MYKKIIRPFLFLFQPEQAHHITFALIKGIFKIPGAALLFKELFVKKDKRLKRTVFGLTFENPVGLAAGFDKNALLIDELACMGFGFIEIGTVTPLAQTGNPKPRLFRLPGDRGLINRMGFNNEGVNAAVEKLKKRKSKTIIGGNIGKNKTTENENAISDYLISFEALFPVVDYFVVNVSSPNTPNLRALQEKEPLKHLLKAIQERNGEKSSPKPILLKIAPDLNNQQLDDIVEIVKEIGIAGVIATNTTISREGLKTEKTKLEALGAGGLSGKPLQQRSTEVVKYLCDKAEGAFEVIAVGGISNGEDAAEKLRAGAALVQVYTGFIYEGPGIVKKINQSLLKNNLTSSFNF